MEQNNNAQMKPTPEWMAEKYAEMNDQYFGGRLGECDFSVSPLKINILGLFSLKGSNLRYRRYGNRGLYKAVPGGQVDITYKNFYNLCRPLISLNQNYIGTEEALLATLVHEMCHYWNYMYGYVPKRAHGADFMEAARYINATSHGRFSIQRVATAEENRNHSISDEHADDVLRKFKNVVPTFIYYTNSDVRLIMAANDKYFWDIVNRYKRFRNVEYIYASFDNELKLKLIALGYSKKTTSMRYWLIKDSRLSLDILNGKYGAKCYYDSHEIEESNTTMNVSKIIKETIDEYMNNIVNGNDDEVGEINPNQNLGLEAPQ